VITVINDEDATDKMSGFTVKIDGPTSNSQPTDSSGKATFKGIPPGDYTYSQTSSSCFINPSPLPSTTVVSGHTIAGGNPNTADLHVHPVHTVLKIKQLAFTGNNPVENDTMGNFAPPEWLDGRAQSAQLPVSYARNKNMAFNATFTVATAPSCTETVTVQGNATFGSASLAWTGTVTVNPGDAGKDLPALSLTSDNPLPNAIGIFESTDITWQSKPASGDGVRNPGIQVFTAAGTTRNVTYVTLGDPSGTPNFWTLLDVSCRAAAGQATAQDLINKGFDGLRSRSINRKRDGQPLTYWKPLPPPTCARSTNQILSSANGAGECGSWAEFLIDMYKVHGVTSADKILIVRTKPAFAAATDGFMVKAWIFDHPPASAANAYTHTAAQCRPGVRIPAQNNTASPSGFYNHFIVRADGKFWDPSYGAGSFADQKAWELAGIDGLFQSVAGGGAITMGGFDKSLNTTTTILEFWNMTTNTKI
jgi:hypothetical protein